MVERSLGGLLIAANIGVTVLVVNGGSFLLFYLDLVLNFLINFRKSGRLLLFGLWLVDLRDIIVGRFVASLVATLVFVFALVFA
jgi:hypothetical protein